MKISTIHKESLKEFDKIIGEVPEHVQMSQYGKEFCMMCGHPTQADKVVRELKSFLTSHTIRTLEAQIEQLKESRIKNQNSVDKIEEIDERARITNELNGNMVFGYQQALSDQISRLEEEIRKIKGI